MRQSIDEIAHRLGSPAGPGIQVQTSRLALDLVRLGMGWTVVDFLTARGLDPAQMVTLELHELAPISLYSYQARAFAPSLQATRMLAMLPRLLHEALQGNGKPAKR
jgi:DNA-binding transcriptional LysR family regulator